MQSQTADQLVKINHQFYQTFALQFSETRQHLQPGVRRVIETFIPPGTRLLDLGCGNGELAHELARQAFTGSYTGLDFSSALLVAARLGLPEDFPAEFLVRDLTVPGWEADLPRRSFDLALAFALLHHIPGDDRRVKFLLEIGRLLVPGGRLIFSVWQFLNSPRLAARIQPWEAAGLSADEVDPGDYLLDWRSGGVGLRYIHHFTPEELAGLAAQTGFTIRQSFSSDGKTGDLGLYQVWDLNQENPG